MNQNNILQLITEEIKESESEVGEDISFSEDYDIIKNARFEEDANLSLGVWKRELKKADWATVQQKSIEILTNRSKDLQVVAWLMESIVAIDVLNGFSKAFEILKSFLESFWYTCFPNNEEQKIAIINWIIENLNKRLFTLNFIGDISLYDYEYAVTLNETIKRSPNSENEILKEADRNGHKHMDWIQNSINSFNQTKIKEVQKKIKNIKDSIVLLVSTIKKIIEEQSIISFSNILENLNKMEKILKNSFVTQEAVIEDESLKQKEEVKDCETMIRSDIYEKLSELSVQLKALEKQGLSPLMLELIISWKDKTLFQIIDDLKTGDTEVHKLLKILIN